jgi:hypothetical protein
MQPPGRFRQISMTQLCRNFATSALVDKTERLITRREDK